MPAILVKMCVCMCVLRVHASPGREPVLSVSETGHLSEINDGLVGDDYSLLMTQRYLVHQ